MTPMALKVNGETVEDAVLAREAEALRRRFEKLSDEQKAQYGLEGDALQRTAVEWARDNVIERVLLRQRAQADPVPVDAAAVERAVREAVERHGGSEKIAEAGLDESGLRAGIESQMRVERLMGAVTSKAKPPRPKDLAQHYKRNRDRYRTEETVRAAHIVKHVEKGVSEDDARRAAETLYAKLQDGASFERVADRESDCPGNGGDLGYFGRGKMVKEFEDVVFALRPGQTSAVFQTVFGFHIAKVTERKPAGVRAFAEVRDEIRKELVERERTKLLENFVDGLREQARIEGAGGDGAGSSEQT